MAKRILTPRFALALPLAVMVVAGCQTAATDRLRGNDTESRESDAAATEPALRQVDGSLQHVFSVAFTADRFIVATVTGLVTQRVARTTTGGELEVNFPPGVPYPQGMGTVTIRQVPSPDNRSALDHLARPPGIAEREGHVIVASHRIASRPTQYLVVWRNRKMGEYSITLFDASNPQAPMPVVARSRTRILGIAHSPFSLAPDDYITVWTLAAQGVAAARERQVMVEAYTWRPTGS